jgi:lipoprotein NlpD
MRKMREQGWTWTLAVVMAALLAACSSPRRAPAPVEDRSQGVRATVATAPDPARVLPGAENAGKPGYYSVRPGETLIRIALDHGQNWRDIARWNNLDNPNVIEVGQVLRVVPPGVSSEAAVRPVAPPAAAASGPAVARAGASAPTLPPVNTPPVAPGDDTVAWMWPTSSGDPVIAGFDEEKNKGLDIGGKAGDPVYAAAEGRVVYAGAGLRGYGNLIILKHNNTYLTAYAHNQTLLVKEDQSVRKGQKIAEMGSSDTDRVKLHFEIRRQGKPVDPTKYLPPR